MRIKIYLFHFFRSEVGSGGGRKKINEECEEVWLLYGYLTCHRGCEGVGGESVTLAEIKKD